MQYSLPWLCIYIYVYTCIYAPIDLSGNPYLETGTGKSTGKAP